MLKAEVRVADIITCTDGEINVLTVLNHGPWVSYSRRGTHYATGIGGDDLNFTKTSIAGRKGETREGMVLMGRQDERTELILKDWYESWSVWKNCSSGLLASPHCFARSHTVRLLYGYVNNASLDLNSDFFFFSPQIHFFCVCVAVYIIITLLFKCGPYQTPLGSGSSLKNCSRMNRRAIATTSRTLLWKQTRGW